MDEIAVPVTIGRRRFLLVGAAAAVLAACGSSSKSAGTATTKAAGGATTAGGTATTAGSGAATTAKATGTTAASGGADISALVAAAKKEGKVNLIALPDDWANYKGSLAGFKAKYGITFDVANPDGSSADEITAVTTLKGQKTQPDAIDVGPSFALDAAKQGLLEKYKVSTWADIPDNMKDADGAWVGGYYGIMAIGTNVKAAGGTPATFKDLTDTKYKGKVALNGDPRKAGAAFAGVWAAALANGGSLDDIGPGIEYFAKLKKDGILIPVDVTPANIVNGQVAIALDWTYNYPGVQAKLKEGGVDLTVSVPSDGVFGNFYAQAAIAGSPNPNAGKLWLEWLLSDEGAIEYLKGGAFPARYGKLAAAGKVPSDLAAKLPGKDVTDKIKFPTAAQTDAAKAKIASDWGPKVAGN